MAYGVLLPQPCLVKIHSFSISQRPKLCTAHCRGYRRLGPPLSLRNHLLPLPSDWGNDLQFLEEQETKRLGA